MRMKTCIASLALALSCLSGLAFAQSRGAAGEVTLLTGQATASAPEGTVRLLNRGDTVYSGEIINSGANSYVNLKFRDGGLVLLRPKTRFQIEQFNFPAEAAAPKPLVEQAAPAPAPQQSMVAAAPQEGGTSRAFFRLLKGGFRAVSGLIGKTDQNDYRVATPVATIGIRGTDYYAEIIDKRFARDPVLRSSLPAGASPEGGVYVQQFEGTTVITSKDGKQVELHKGHSLVTLKTGGPVEVPEAEKIKNDPPPDPKNCKS